MIKSIKHFEAIIGYPISEIEKISFNLKDYYYSYSKLKKSGRKRVFCPSKKELKDIQNRIISRIFSNVVFPYFILGSVKKRSGVLNSKFHFEIFF